MRSKFLLAGMGIAAVLAAVAFVAAVLEWWWLVVLAAMALLSAIFLVALDADRRVRALRPYIRGEMVRSGSRADRRGPARAEPPPVVEADIVGAVKVLQAQYTGRLDRMQGSLDEAVALVRAEARGEDPPTSTGEKA